LQLFRHSFPEQLQQRLQGENVDLYLVAAEESGPQL
jgi:hypothetical protein